MFLKMFDIHMMWQLQLTLLLCRTPRLGHSGLGRFGGDMKWNSEKGIGATAAMQDFLGSQYNFRKFWIFVTTIKCNA